MAALDPPGGRLVGTVMFAEVGGWKVVVVVDVSSVAACMIRYEAKDVLQRNHSPSVCGHLGHVSLGSVH